MYCSNTSVRRITGSVFFIIASIAFLTSCMVSNTAKELPTAVKIEKVKLENISGTSFNEGSTATITVTANAKFYDDVTVVWTLSGSGNDFPTATGLLTFLSGSNAATLNLPMRTPDLVYQPQRIYSLSFVGDTKLFESNSQFDITVTDVTLISLLNGNQTLFSGESVLFTASSAAASSSYVDSGTGYVNATTGLYSVPINAAPASDFVRATDSNGNSLQANISIRSFQTAQTYIPMGPTTLPMANKVAKDSLGNIYVAGRVTSGLTSRQTIRKSSDGGATWATVYDRFYKSGSPSDSVGLVIDSTNRIFLLAQIYNSDTFLTVSDDQGLTWTTRFQGSIGVSSINSFAISPSGILFACGYGGTIVRSIDGGLTWNIVDSFIYPGNSGYSTYTPNTLAIDSNGVVYVTGETFSATLFSNRYLVRKSVDSGITWTTVLDITAATGGIKQAYAKSVTVDSTNTVYVTGWEYDNSLNSYSLIYKSTDAGANWTKIRNSTSDSFCQSLEGGIASDGTGNVVSNCVIYNGSNSFLTSANSGSTWANNAISYLASTIRPNGVFAVAANTFYAVAKGSDNHWLTLKSTTGGTSWTIVDNYSPTVGYSSAANAVISTDATTLFSVGWGATTGTKNHWIVQKSTDSGATWSVVDDYLFNAAVDSSATSIVKDGLGNIFVSGNGGSSGWAVRKSSDNGVSWTTISDYKYMTTSTSIPGGAVVDTNNNLYIVGASRDATKYHLIVRKSADAGSTWTTVLDYLYDSLNPESESYASITAKAVAIDSANNIYVLTSNSTNYVVLKSSNGGTSWSTIMDYRPANATASEATGLAIADNGDILISGFSVISSQTKWLTLKRTVNGQVSILHNYQLANSYSSMANGIAIDTNGLIFVSGVAIDSDNNKHWQIFKSSDGGLTWGLIEDFRYADGYSSSAAQIKSCFTNRMCVAGQANDLNDYPKWVVRILSAIP